MSAEVDAGRADEREDRDQEHGRGRTEPARRDTQPNDQQHAAVERGVVRDVTGWKTRTGDVLEHLDREPRPRPRLVHADAVVDQERAEDRDAEPHGFASPADPQQRGDRDERSAHVERPVTEPAGGSKHRSRKVARCTANDSARSIALAGHRNTPIAIATNATSIAYDECLLLTRDPSASRVPAARLVSPPPLATSSCRSGPSCQNDSSFGRRPPERTSRIARHHSTHACCGNHS
jgi:hypothetical protein